MRDFSFVVISDSHVDARPGGSDGGYWNTMLTSRSRDILSAAVGDINARGVDFVAHCGDITNASDTESYRAVAEILSGLNCPFYFVLGNHDTWLEDRRGLAAELFGLEDPGLYRAVEFAGWRLLLLDFAYWVYRDGSIKGHYDLDNPARVVDIIMPDRELDWLGQELRRDPSTPTVCFTHPVLAVRPEYPVARMPGGEPVTKRPVTLEGELCGSGRLKAVLAGHPCVKAVFSGHGHMHDCIVEDGVLYCQTGALVSYPNEPRLVRVKSDRIETEVFPLSRGDFAELSYRPEWGNRWVAGRPVDRCMTHYL